MTEEEFWSILHSAPEPKPVIYRLYHDAAGFPLFYSMEDVPGTYVDLTFEEFSRGESNIRVRDGKIVPVTWQTAIKLTPNDVGTACDPRDITVVVDPNNKHTQWTKKTYETN